MVKMIKQKRLKLRYKEHSSAVKSFVIPELNEWKKKIIIIKKKYEIIKREKLMNENKILKELYEFILEKTDKKTF